jgi:hypothetical protein
VPEEMFISDKTKARRFTGELLQKPVPQASWRGSMRSSGQAKACSSVCAFQSLPVAGALRMASTSTWGVSGRRALDAFFGRLTELQ